MEQDKIKTAPLPSVRRLPLYLGFLRQLKVKGRPAVSCTHIAEAFGFDSVQVRKDLAVTGIVGKPKVGYSVDSLIDVIESFLGWNDISNAFLVGAGSLGSAFLGYDRFREYGIEIIAAFDNNPRKIGSQIHGKEVLPMDKLPNLAARMHVHTAVITVPAAVAQEVAQQLIEAGIRGILNFSPQKLDVPPHVVVEDVSLASSIASLSSRMRAHRKNEALINEHDIPHCGFCEGIDKTGESGAQPEVNKGVK